MKTCQKIRKWILVFLLFVGVLSYNNIEVKSLDFGEEAYAFLQEIDASYPCRVTDKNWPDTSFKTAAGNWIKEKLLSFGYPEVQESHYEIDGLDTVSYFVRKEGKEEKTIVIGAHYDSAVTSAGLATKGVEDNGTGVSLCLELAKRFQNVETNLSIEFCFWDAEETEGYAGSYGYLEHKDINQILLYINLDSIGSGDNLYVYGGDYEEGILVRDWGYNMAKEIGYKNNVELRTIPETLRYGAPPARYKNSDHYYFNQKKIPYVYFEANCWTDEDGNFPQEYEFLYNSNLSAFQDTNGQIIHTTENEDLAVLESKIPGRIQEHLTKLSVVVSQMIQELDEDSSYIYAEEIRHGETPTSEASETSTTEALSTTTEIATSTLEAVTKRETTTLAESQTQEEITTLENTTPTFKKEEEKTVEGSNQDNQKNGNAIRTLLIVIWIATGLGICFLIFIIMKKQNSKKEQ